MHIHRISANTSLIARQHNQKGSLHRIVHRAGHEALFQHAQTRALANRVKIALKHEFAEINRRQIAQQRLMPIGVKNKE